MNKTKNAVIAIAVAAFGFMSFNLKANDETKKSIVLPTVNTESKINSGYQESIKVFYTVDPNGKVNQVSARTENTQVKKALEDKMLKMEFPGKTPNIGNLIIVNLKVY